MKKTLSRCCRKFSQYSTAGGARPGSDAFPPPPAIRQNSGAREEGRDMTQNDRLVALITMGHVSWGSKMLQARSRNRLRGDINFRKPVEEREGGGQRAWTGPRASSGASGRGHSPCEQISTADSSTCCKHVLSTKTKEKAGRGTSSTTFPAAGIHGYSGCPPLIFRTSNTSLMASLKVSKL